MSGRCVEGAGFGEGSLRTVSRETARRKGEDDLVDFDEGDGSDER